ncbi:MAG: pyrrolo-quinoline quinone [Oscillospiraceae bacterium]|nr:pyrrolo-quinoline quinone [Oscillospiraceae bacterium]
MGRKDFYRGLFKFAVLVALLVCLCVLVYDLAGMLAEEGTALERLTVSAAYTSPTPGPTPSPDPTATPAPTPEPTALPEFEPVTVASEVITSTSIMVDGEVVESYQADEDHYIDFGGAEEYSLLDGIVTFRGNNFRNTASYGVTEITEAAFGDYWVNSTTGLSDNSGSFWGGSGWTGQPLIVEWPAETKAIMNMYDWAKEKDGLVEVIYATLGGYVYFYDLETGEATRDALNLGYTFKGAGSLDPRGYPLLYLGGGVVNASGSVPRIMVVSLIDGEVLYTTGNGDSFAPRSWYAWDSSPLVDAETDQLIYPGENGVLYLIQLNSDYDEAAGTLTVDPTVVKFTYTSTSADKYLYGMEDSAIIWRGYLFIADNGGDFLCIDLNTLTICWRFDCLDDTNCTGVLEVDETGHPYVYLSTSYHLGFRSYGTAVVPVWKIDAVTGEELWTVTSDSYSWSSSTCFYDTEGNGYVLYTSCINGKMYLVDGLTGDVLDTFSFGCTMEASPVVYNNTVVIGTRGQQIYGITLE